jgi:hypothetical protein
MRQTKNKNTIILLTNLPARRSQYGDFNVGLYIAIITTTTELKLTRTINTSNLYISYL